MALKWELNHCAACTSKKKKKTSVKMSAKDRHIGGNSRSSRVHRVQWRRPASCRGERGMSWDLGRSEKHRGRKTLASGGMMHNNLEVLRQRGGRTVERIIFLLVSLARSRQNQLLTGSFSVQSACYLETGHQGLREQVKGKQVRLV